MTLLNCSEEEGKERGNDVGTMGKRDSVRKDERNREKAVAE